MTQRHSQIRVSLLIPIISLGKHCPGVRQGRERSDFSKISFCPARALQLQGSGFRESLVFEDVGNILKIKYLIRGSGEGERRDIIAPGTRTCIFKDSNNIEYGLKI